MAQFSYKNPEVNAQVLKYWDTKWIAVAGKPKKAKISKASGKLIGTKRGGRRVYFTLNGKKQEFSISGSRSKVALKGKDAERGDLKTGMSCSYTYAPRGKRLEVKKIDCK
jgi:hypothetical protein